MGPIGPIGRRTTKTAETTRTTNKEKGKMVDRNRWLGLLSFIFAAVVPVFADNSVPTSVTFSRDVAPILQNHCQSCHRPGEAAPMALLTYEQVRPWSKSIREKV